jgi:hypothetical protein
LVSTNKVFRDSDHIFKCAMKSNPAFIRSSSIA